MAKAEKIVGSWHVYISPTLIKCAKAHMKELHMTNQSEYIRKVLTDLYFDHTKGIYRENPPC